MGGHFSKVPVQRISAKMLKFDKNDKCLMSSRFCASLIKHSLPNSSSLRESQVEKLKKFLATSTVPGKFGVRDRIAFEKQIYKGWKHKKIWKFSKSVESYLEHVLYTINNDRYYLNNLIKIGFTSELNSHRARCEHVSMLSRLYQWILSFYRVRVQAKMLRRQQRRSVFHIGLEQSHILSLSLAVQLWEKVFGHRFVTEQNLRKLRILINNEMNFNLCSFRMNRVVHVQQDNEISRAIRKNSFTYLSSGASSRSKEICKFLKSQLHSCPDRKLRKYINGSLKVLQKVTK